MRKIIGMCSCFYLRITQRLLRGLTLRLTTEVTDMIVRIKRTISRGCYTECEPLEPPERPPEKKQSPLHHSGSNSSLSEMRATRPLPPPPDRLTYVDQSWFHSITREQANAVIRERPHNGYFLLRPSNTNPNNPFVLTLWFNDGVYNVQVRKRPDSRYALGSPRAQEQSFASVEEIVQFHSREELPLCRGRVQTGSTLLTDTPPKRLNP
uniref:Lcp2_2 protein n=1 Tax=Fopius arisanus TaxID=64838 RepID=A0A0C9QWM2_9HYME